VVGVSRRSERRAYQMSLAAESGEKKGPEERIRAEDTGDRRKKHLEPKGGGAVKK